MVKKIRKMRTFARTASKSMEKRLLENAKKIKADPYIVLPDYSDKRSEKAYKKIRKSIDKIVKYKDNEKKLEKISNKRGLEAAVAGTILLANSGKAPYLAVSKLPTGEITYAQRGKADKEKLIAVQHFDDPILRLIGVKDISLKKKLHVYSWDKGFLSTGDKPNPPTGFINFIIKNMNFSYDEKVAIKGNLKKELVKKKSFSKKNYLRIFWRSADIIFAIAEDKTNNTKNTLIEITKYLVEPDISNDFEIDVVGQVVERNEKVSTNKTEYIDEYLIGKISDSDLIKKNMSDRKKQLVDSGEKVFILDGKSYGQNKEQFIKALNPNSYEKKSLDILLSLVDEPVIFNDATPNKILDNFWKDYGLEIIKAIIDDEEISKKFYSLRDPPSEIVELAIRFKERQKILQKLPNYKNLPPLAKFADDIARTYRTFGVNKALSEIKKRPDDTKGKSIAYAFLLAMNKGVDKKWQYSQIEIEYGNFLKDYAKKLLEGDPAEYHKALQELLTASGSSEQIDNYLKK